jgi:hydroxyacyl-ACP dehydratase HTD2-like protein with hotdog domain
MSTWKKYGGTNKLDKINNITVNTVVADQLTLKNVYVGDWDICGGLRTRDDAIIGGNLYALHDVTTDGNLTVNGAMNVFDTNILGNLNVDNNLLVRESIYMDSNLSTLFTGVDSKFGFNKSNPQATIDISSNLERTLDMYSSATNNKNVVARNSADQGITVNVEPTRAYIDFYVDDSMNLTTENASGRLLYESGGNLTVDVSNVMKIKPRVIFSQDLTKNFLDDERVVIYADAGTPYLPVVYNNPTFKSSMALNMVANDNSSNVYAKIGTPQGNGIALSGGAGPGPSGKGQIMGTLAVTTSSQMYPAFNVFSGILTQNLPTSIGFNKSNVATYDTSANKYMLDINGPIRVAHQETLLVNDASFQIYASTSVGNTVYAVGEPATVAAPFEQYFLKSIDGGYTWTTNRILGSGGLVNPNSLENSPHIFKAIYAISSSYILIGGDNRYFFRTQNGGATWTLIDATGGTNDQINAGALYVSPDQSRLLIGLETGSINAGSIINSNTWASTGYSPTYIATGLSSVNGIKGSDNYVVIVGDSGARVYDISNNLFGALLSGNVAYDVDTYDTTAIIVGENTLTYTTNFKTLNPSWQAPLVAPSGIYRKVKMLDSSRAIAIGDGGIIAYSVDGFITWYVANLNDTYLAGLDLKTISLINANDFVISSADKVYNFFSPYLLNRSNYNVIEASGNMVVSGDLQINELGQLLTNNTVFNILPTSATTINIGSTGNTVVNTNLITIGDASFNKTFRLGGDASLNSKLFVKGDASFNSTFMLGGDASLNSKLFVQSDASFNSRFFLGGDASLNSKLFVQSDASLNSRLYLGGDASLNSKLFVKGDVSFNQLLQVGDNATFNTTIHVIGDASLNSNLFVSGDASFNKTLQLGGNALLYSNLFLSGDASFNQALYLGGDASLNSRLFVNGDVSFNQTLQVGDNATFNKSMRVIGDASLNSNLFVSGDASLNSTLRVGGNASLNSNLFLGGDASFNQVLRLGGDASFNSRLFVNGDVSFNQVLQVGGNATFNRILRVIGDASLNSNLFVSGDASFNKTLRLGGDASLNSNLFVNGDVSFNKTLRLGGDASFNARLFVQSDASFNTRLFVGNDVSLNRKLYVASNASMYDISARHIDLTGTLRANTIDNNTGTSLFVGSTNATNVYVQANDTVYLGNTSGNVVIRGNLTLPTNITSTNINNLEITNKTILLNDGNPSNNSSAYSGFYIRDNSSDNASYLLQNGTMDGFIFKSAQNANRVNLDVSGLKLANGSQQFVVLRPAAVSSVSADFTITTAIVSPSDISGLDASLNRRVERDIVNTTATTQVLSTGLLATGLYANKTVGQIISNTQLDINGNCIATRVGLGTNAVNTNYALDIVGNTRTNANVDISGSLTVQTNANIYGFINSYGTIVQW